MPDSLPAEVEEQQASYAQACARVVDLSLFIDGLFMRQEKSEPAKDESSKSSSGIIPALALSYDYTYSCVQEVPYMKINSHFHSARDVAKTPANRAPSQPPMGAAEAKKPMVRLRDRPGGSMMVIMATALGMTSPPPTPVRARTATKLSYDAQKAFAMENTTMMAPPSRRMR